MADHNLFSQLNLSHLGSKYWRNYLGQHASLHYVLSEKNLISKK